MIFIFNAKGECLASTPSEVNQGNLGVNDIIIIAPFPSTAVITAAVQLPNKQLISPQYVEGENGITPDADEDLKFTLLESFSEKLGLLGTPVNVWKLTLKRALTQLAGDLKLSFSVFSDGDILETDTVTLAVTRTVPTLSPTATAEDLDGIAQLLAAMNVVREEAQKILTDAEGEFSREFAKKLDRIDLTPEQIESGQYWIYAIRDIANAGMIQCESDIKADTIVYRGSDGHFKVNDPVEDEHPTNKRYVDLTCEDFVTRVSMVYDSKNYTMSLVYNSVLPDGSVSRRLLGPPIDLPLESVVLNATYDDATKSIVLELVNGTTTSIPVGELVSELVTTSELNGIAKTIPTNIQNGETKNSLQQRGNKAISENSFATGNGTIAGCRAFTVKSYSGTTITLNDATGISGIIKKQPFCSIVARFTYSDGEDYHTLTDVWYQYARITSVNGNVVTISKAFELEDGVTVNAIENIVLFDYPELGDADYGMFAFTTGELSKGMGRKSRASGDYNMTIGNDSIAEGHSCFATTYSRATGVGSRADFRSSEASGRYTRANASGASSKGGYTSSNGRYSSSEGYRTVAGDENNESILYKMTGAVAAHAEGISTLALTRGSHAQNKDTVAGSKGYRITNLSHTGTQTRIVVATLTGLEIGQTINVVTDKIVTAPIIGKSASNSRVIIDLVDISLVTDGNGNILSTDPATGLPVNYFTVVGEPLLGDIEVGLYADASGLGTVAPAPASSARGMYNKDLGQDYIDYVGNGTSDTDRSNAYVLDKDGNATFAGDVFVRGGEKLGKKLYRHDIEIDNTDGWVFMTVYNTDPTNYSWEYDDEDCTVDILAPFLPENAISATGFNDMGAGGGDGFAIIAVRLGENIIGYQVYCVDDYWYTWFYEDIYEIIDTVTEVM